MNSTSRLLLLAATFAVIPALVAFVPRSFQPEALQRITLPAALPQEPERVNLTERVLTHLEKAEKKEIDPWYRDDIRIAWITTLWAQNGVPDWSFHRQSPPHVAATYQVLGCHPDQVWARILAQRQAKLGDLYSPVFEGLAKRKPVRSVTLAEFEQRRFEQRKNAA